MTLGLILCIIGIICFLISGLLPFLPVPIDSQTRKIAIFLIPIFFIIGIILVLIAHLY